MSFIGHELVNWLVEKVQGFESRKQARLFANRLLELGLIKHAVNMNRFSEKCYYKFDGELLNSFNIHHLHYRQNQCRTPTTWTTSQTEWRKPDWNHLHDRPIIRQPTTTTTNGSTTNKFTHQQRPFKNDQVTANHSTTNKYKTQRPRNAQLHNRHAFVTNNWMATIANCCSNIAEWTWILSWMRLSDHGKSTSIY